ncbi:MAG: phosphatidylserine decarboxylase family protein [Candidatus Abyssobacteria bacterium SURF_17]|uniref:Phosphatidylserine decarboxylase family protein n=1 Tax=Candidatus Abyssobacteria bacterium SURF_17 TaxID=2093361 RepID=A0A419F0K1_9BACT|nr:MAG: phosphatidylserine decarboxylase family protein [Candidatus Abyssubacteria bacterium SURF_17]
MAAVCLAVLAFGLIVHPAIAWLGLVAALFTLYFFRDPERIIIAKAGHIVAPADGKVVAIDEVDETEYVGERCKRVSIFLSILDVHINRAPVSGQIGMIRHKPGRFALAHTLDASRSNECNMIGIKGDEMKVLVKQIAGAVARRIICYCKPTQVVRTGERIGMIRFGSRTEVYLPRECQILVSEGEKVKGGVSLIGVYDAAFTKKA